MVAPYFTKRDLLARLVEAQSAQVDLLTKQNDQNERQHWDDMERLRKERCEAIREASELRYKLQDAERRQQYDTVNSATLLDIFEAGQAHGSFTVSDIEGLDMIPAIKKAREVLGIGLLSAKKLVDAYRDSGRFVPGRLPTTEEEAGDPSDELVAALAGGGPALAFEPDDDDLDF